MEQSSKLDNQQTTAFEFGWLIGAIDGEGCIGLSKRNRQKSINLKPHIQIANCDKDFINRCIRILSDLNIPHWVSHYEGKNRRRESWQIAITGLKRVNKFLPLIKDLLCLEKREKANLVYEFVLSRLSDWHAAPFTERQIEIYEKIAELNTKGRKARSLRDYTRNNRSSKYPIKDIVQTTTEKSGLGN